MGSCLLSLMASMIFQTVRACVKRGSGNICSVSVFFVRVGSQISPPPGEQDQLNALPQGQQRQSNPHPMPCPPPPPPPRRLNIDRCITLKPVKPGSTRLSILVDNCQKPGKSGSTMVYQAHQAFNQTFGARVVQMLYH